MAKTFSHLFDGSKVSLGQLESALEQSCPTAIAWCARADAPLQRRALCAAIVENLDHPLRVTFQECIVRRWLEQQTAIGPARFELVLEPGLDFLEAGRVSLRLVITASLELAAHDAAARLKVDNERRVLLLPQGAAWKASLRLSIRDPDQAATGTEFHSAPPQDVYLPEVIPIGGVRLRVSGNGEYPMNTKSYVGKVYVIESKDARIRDAVDLLQYLRYQEGDQIPQGRQVGDPKLVPQATRVRVTDARVTDKNATFVLIEDAAAGSNLHFGWTSATNLQGVFLNETIGQIDPEGNDKFGLNAAWEKGKFIGQKTLVEIVGQGNETERIVLENMVAYLNLANAAALDEIAITLVSGFRTYIEQEYLYKLHNLNPEKYPTAAEPGRSNHQHGQAFDLNVSGYEGNPVYDWLKTNGPKLGFIRTVNKEPWHWEYRPDDAAKLAATGGFKAADVET